MFNILSGLQEGSHSVTIVQRAAAGVETFVKGQVVFADTAGAISATFTGAAGLIGKCVEWVFEDVANQASKMYTLVFGSFEAETDQMTATLPVAGDFLKADLATGKMTKATATTDDAIVIARCISVKAASTDPATGASLGAIYRFRTL